MVEKKETLGRKSIDCHSEMAEPQTDIKECLAVIRYKYVWCLANLSLSLHSMYEAKTLLLLRKMGQSSGKLQMKII